MRMTATPSPPGSIISPDYIASPRSLPTGKKTSRRFSCQGPSRDLDDPLDVLALLPKLRLAARVILLDSGAADRLVQSGAGTRYPRNCRSP